MNKKRSIVIKSLLITALTVPTAVAQEQGTPDAVSMIKEEIQKKWEVVPAPEQVAYVLRSPAYAMEHNGGCVRYLQIYPSSRSKIYFSRVEFETLYFANASGVVCATVLFEKFFRIESGSDVGGLLDFTRKVYVGVNVDRDKFEKHDLTRLKNCFSGANKAHVWVFKAWSELQEGTINQEYHLVLRCPSLSSADEIFVSGSEDRDEIVWKIVGSRQIDVDDVKIK